MTDEEEQRADHTESRGTDVHDDDVIRDVDYSTMGGPSQPQPDTVTESMPPKGIAVTRVPLLGDGAVIKAEEYQRLWTTFTERSSELLMELKEAPTSIAVLETALATHKVDLGRGGRRVSLDWLVGWWVGECTLCLAPYFKTLSPVEYTSRDTLRVFSLCTTRMAGLVGWLVGW